MTRQRTQWGFTLVEILVAVTIIATIVSMVYGSYRAASGSAQSYKQSSTAQQKAHLALHQLAAQVRCAYVPENASPLAAGDDTSLRAGHDAVRVEAQSPLFTGSNRSEGDILQFVTMKSLFPEQPQVQVQYTTTVSLEKGSGQLILSQRPHSGTTPPNLPKRRCLVLADRVTQITLAYYDGSEWQNNWSSRERHGLPQAVRCGLTVQDKRNKFYTSHIIAPILCSMPHRGSAAKAVKP